MYVPLGSFLVKLSRGTLRNKVGKYLGGENSRNAAHPTVAATEGELLSEAAAGWATTTFLDLGRSRRAVA